MTQKQKIQEASCPFEDYSLLHTSELQPFSSCEFQYYSSHPSKHIKNFKNTNSRLSIKRKQDLLKSLQLAEEKTYYDKDQFIDIIHTFIDEMTKLQIFNTSLQNEDYVMRKAQETNKHLKAFQGSQELMSRRAKTFINVFNHIRKNIFTFLKNETEKPFQMIDAMFSGFPSSWNLSKGCNSQNVYMTVPQKRKYNKIKKNVYSIINKNISPNFQFVLKGLNEHFQYNLQDCKLFSLFSKINMWGSRQMYDRFCENDFQAAWNWLDIGNSSSENKNKNKIQRLNSSVAFCKVICYKKSMREIEKYLDQHYRCKLAFCDINDIKSIVGNGPFLYIDKRAERNCITSNQNNQNFENNALWRLFQLIYQVRVIGHQGIYLHDNLLWKSIYDEIKDSSNKLSPAKTEVDTIRYDKHSTIVNDKKNTNKVPNEQSFIRKKRGRPRRSLTKNVKDKNEQSIINYSITRTEFLNDMNNNYINNQSENIGRQTELGKKYENIMLETSPRMKSQKEKSSSVIRIDLESLSRAKEVTSFNNSSICNRIRDNDNNSMQTISDSSESKSGYFQQDEDVDRTISSSDRPGHNVYFEIK